MSEELRNLFEYINTNRVAENDSFIRALDDAVQKWNTGDKMDMLLTATQKDQAIKEEKARQEGRREQALEVAGALLKEGISVEVISRCTGLSIDEIEAL